MSSAIAACSLITPLDGLDGVPTTDAGVEAASDAKPSDANAADADGGVACGFPGETCCVAPLAPCEQGLVCNGTSKCMVSDAWALGQYSAVLEASVVNVLVTAHWDGAAWTQGKPVLTETGPPSIPAQILESSGGELRAIFNTTTIGKMYAYNGVSWQECKTGNACLGPQATAKLWAVAAVSNSGAAEFWVAGTNVMYRCANGQATCTSVTNGISGTWGTGTFAGTTLQDLWYSVFDHVLHYDGTVWSSQPVADARAIGMLGKNDLWAGDKQFRHYDGNAWSSPYLADGSPFTANVTSIDGAGPKYAFAVGSLSNSPNAAYAAHWDGSTWTKTPLPANLTAVSNVYAPSPIEAFVVGRNGVGTNTGVFAQWDGTKWNAVPSPTISYPGETMPGVVNWVSVTGRARPRR